MLRGLYESASGMIARMQLQDMTANNLANVHTDGFQRQIAALHARRAEADTPAAAKTDPLRLPEWIEPFSTTDARPGGLHPTENPGDVALDGPGYFTAQTNRGVRLFRSASLHANARGELALTSGEPVLGRNNGPIPVGSDPFQIGADGTVTGSDGKSLGQLRVVRALGSVQPEGGSLSIAEGIAEIPPGSVGVRGGFLEQSNVNPMSEMVNMIAGMRAYEAGQRTIQAQDQTLQNLLSLLQG